MTHNKLKYEPMHVDTSNPVNWPVLSYFDINKPDDEIEIYRVSDIPKELMEEAYFGCGSHPEIVGRVWDKLGQKIPDEACCLLNGHNCLLHDQTGIILAVCMGTQYSLRITDNSIEDAIGEGLSQECNWGGSGDFTDLRMEFGTNWFFGSFADQEIKWIQESYDDFRISP
ncbi:hypothetical protein [Gimesia sp.]|uniref:hypothetical protein n=1 Tax=Gimesia sp. TaxID=2024833 RepID=UPI0032EDF8AE